MATSAAVPTATACRRWVHQVAVHAPCYICVALPLAAFAAVACAVATATATGARTKAAAPLSCFAAR